MFFNLLNESILRDVTESGTLLQYVHGTEKEFMLRKVNGQMEQDLQNNGDYVHYKNAETNTFEEAFNRAPMFINFLKHRGYKNILFVGHYNTGQYQWILESRMDRVVDVQPLERSNMTTMVDPNIVLQMMPLVYKMYGYKGAMSVLRPRESRFRGIVHSVYKQNGLSSNYVESSVQYKHGMSSTDVQFEQGQKFDAVVFLGVPKHKESAFTEETVRDTFSSVITEDAEFVDLYYSDSTKGKFVGAEKKDHKEDWDYAFNLRALWDETIQKDGGRPEEYDIMNRMISVY